MLPEGYRQISLRECAADADASADATLWQGWCDGVALPNPGRLAAGVRLCSPAGECVERSLALGRQGCSNEAELQALCLALELARDAGARRLRLCSDSSVAVEYVSGRARTSVVRLQPLIAAARELLRHFDEVVLVWVPRHRNAMADRLARQALGLAPAAPAPAKRRRR